MAAFKNIHQRAMKSEQNISANKLKVAIRYWLQHHADCARKSLQRLLENPFSFTITILMISIAFTIPAAVYVLFSSAENLAASWSNDKQVTLFLRDDVNLQTAQSLRDKLVKRLDIESAAVISKDEALKDFKQQSNLGSIADSLPSNPIPHIVIATPSKSVTELSALKTLQTELQKLSGVELVQFDLVWIQRLQTMLEVLFRILWLITILLLAAVALIIANVIRWEVASRHDELEIIRLVGGTDAYVRRPFLYSGFWLGFLGAGLAVVIVKISGWVIGNSLQKLMDVYESDIQLTVLPVSLVLLILLSGGVFGTGGAWLAVRQRLQSFA